MRMLTMEEVDAVAGAGWWSDFWRGIGDALTSAVTNVIDFLGFDGQLRYQGGGRRGAVSIVPVTFEPAEPGGFACDSAFYGVGGGVCAATDGSIYGAFGIGTPGRLLKNARLAAMMRSHKGAFIGMEAE